MKRSLYIGRFQPFHDGHRAMVQHLLDSDPDRRVCIAVRMVRRDADNPSDPSEVYMGICEEYQYEKRVMVIFVPDIDEVVYGRDVGYAVRQVRLPSEVEAIRGRDIRAKRREQDAAGEGATGTT